MGLDPSMRSTASKRPAPVNDVHMATVGRSNFFGFQVHAVEQPLGFRLFDC